MEEELGGSKSRSLVFAVNGERFELAEIDPSITLLEFLRTKTRFTGAKLGCGEGGCGACVVLMATFDPVNENVKEFAVSSCLTLLCSINQCSITTTEGLGNSRDGFHSIHRRFAGFHASQCGFCTPGMCISFYSALSNSDKTERPNPRRGFSNLTVSEAEKAIAGNLCRCTGYRAIVDACRSFAGDVDLEDLGLNSFWKKGERCSNVNRLPYYGRDAISTFPEFLIMEIKSGLKLNQNLEVKKSIDYCSWYRPNSIDDLFKLLSNEGKDRIKMVVGNTGSGIYKDEDIFDKLIDLRGIPELLAVKRDSNGVSLGAAVTISRAIEVLNEGGKSLVFSKISMHMSKVASHFVRNSASIGGNLILAKKRRFPSDIATVLLAADSTVCIQTNSEKLVISLEKFLETPLSDFNALLISIYIPSWTSETNQNSKINGFADSKLHDGKEFKLLFDTYRASPRPLGNAVAYLNSAFLANISLDKDSGDCIIDNLRLTFGAYGGEHAIRAIDAEFFLAGKAITSSVLLEAAEMIKMIIIPKYEITHLTYRSSLAVSFLFQFFLPLCKDLKNIKHLSTSLSNGSVIPDELNGSSDDCFDNLDLQISSTQTLDYSMQYRPIGEPVNKVGAELQASGEAIYVDDIPSPKGCLFGAFICSTKPLTHIKGIKFKSSNTSQHIITLISAADIPDGGKNIGTGSIFGTDPLFADSLTDHSGQPLGLVIAETQRLANFAAKQAVVDYSTENLEAPILTVEEAVRRSSLFEVPSFLCPEQVGDFSKGLAEADHSIISAEINLPSQYYFYMETQTALAVPDEDNCIIVYSSSQCPEHAGQLIAKCLGIPENKVRVITRRVGGGFGGKAIRSVPIATACALAAHKLRRPVRMYLDRRTDMIIAGGRHPMKIKYSVGFKSNGKITALHVDLLINAGFSLDISLIMPHNIIGALKKYNWGAFSFDAKLCKTNLPSKSAMRAPGETQGSYIAEAVVEHVASFLSIDSNCVRKENLHSFDSLKLFYNGSEGDALEYTLPSLCDKLLVTSNYDRRADTIQRFNQFSKWKKRGISWMPVIHPVLVMSKSGKVGILRDGSIVVEVGGIELGQGLWTKVKQMAAFALGQLWSGCGPDILERIRVVQADTLSLIQGGWTSGSTSSESSCEAVRLACNALVDRLRPLKDSLEEQMGSVSWDDLILSATFQSVNLSASSLWVPDEASKKYLNYGAAVSEVEIDLLTGATTILRADLIYDCGQSLNPAIDLGQIEGAFVQGIGFFSCEQYLSNSDGLVISDGTWTYKIPTVDNIPKKFNVEMVNSGHHEKRILSSKASGEPPLLLAASVHCAVREAIRAARTELFSAMGSNESPLIFQLDVPATMPVIKELCGLDNVERYLKASIKSFQKSQGTLN